MKMADAFEAKMWASEVAMSAHAVGWSDTEHLRDYMNERAEDAFAKLAKAMGYRIERLEE